MDDAINRLKEEKKELDSKLAKLNDFIGGSIYNSLGFQDKVLLRSQRDVMATYSNILSLRIESLKSK